MTLPVSFYLDKIEEGVIQPSDLAAILERKDSHLQVSEFLSEVMNADADQNTPHILTVSDVATQLTKKDWNRFVTARISSWAAAYFDTGQATWKSANQETACWVVAQVGKRMLPKLTS